jgi:hypothetical protein
MNDMDTGHLAPLLARRHGRLHPHLDEQSAIYAPLPGHPRQGVTRSACKAVPRNDLSQPAFSKPGIDFPARKSALTRSFRTSTSNRASRLLADEPPAAQPSSVLCGDQDGQQVTGTDGLGGAWLGKTDVVLPPPRGIGAGRSRREIGDLGLAAC